MPARLSGAMRALAPAALHAAKTAVAAALAWFVAAQVLHNNVPVFAPLAALLVVQVTVWESVSRALQRVVGVVIGVLVAYGFARLAGINTWSIAVVIFVSLLAGRLLRLGQQGSIQVPVSALLVLVLGTTTSASWSTYWSSPIRTSTGRKRPCATWPPPSSPCSPAWPQICP